MVWLADTEATTGYGRPRMRSCAPLAAMRGQPSAWPTGTVATQVSSVAMKARL